MSLTWKASCSKYSFWYLTPSVLKCSNVTEPISIYEQTVFSLIRRQNIVGLNLKYEHLCKVSWKILLTFSLIFLRWVFHGFCLSPDPAGYFWKVYFYRNYFNIKYSQKIPFMNSTIFTKGSICFLVCPFIFS